MSLWSPRPIPGVVPNLWPKALRSCKNSLGQGYSNGGPRSESGPLDGDDRTLSASQRCILYPDVFIPKSCAFGLKLYF